MEYVKNLLSDDIKGRLRDIEKSNLIAEENEKFRETNAIHRKNIYPKIKQLIFVCRLIMSMVEIEAYLMPYKEFCELEIFLKKY